MCFQNFGETCSDVKFNGLYNGKSTFNISIKIYAGLRICLATVLLRDCLTMFDPHIGPQTSTLQIIRNHAKWFPYILRWHARGKLIWFLASITMPSKDSSWCAQTCILGLIEWYKSARLMQRASRQKNNIFVLDFYILELSGSVYSFRNFSEFFQNLLVNLK